MDQEMKTETYLYEAEHIADARPDDVQKAQAFCEEYKAFMDNAKTEREATAEAVRLLDKAGYTPFEYGRTYEAGAKTYVDNRGKCVIACTIGRRPLADGVRLAIAHIDSPRLDMKPNPLYEDAGLALFKTHYYGGIRKYQWGATPLALHGVVYRADGTCANVRSGEDEGDPVFCVTDLLPHLAADQSKRTLAEGLKGEELNVVLASLPDGEADDKKRFKRAVMRILHEKYGITERDFPRAELCAVPAGKAVDVGFDRSLIGAYGHDDRVCAYTALRAEMDTASPEYTTVCVLTDKEEVGSDGVTGLNSDYLFHFLQDLADMQGVVYRHMLRISKCLSADVNAALDPTFPEVHEKNNAAYINHGVCVTKYTGARGKSSTNDASAELLAFVTNLLDAEGVCWQTGELGKVDQGGGGTIAKYVANRNIDTLDIGVPMLSMHAPFELVAKLDVYHTYLAFCAFAK